MNSSSTLPRSSNASLVDLLRDFGRQATQYLSDLKQLFLLEMQQNARYLTIAAVSLGIAAILALFGFALLTVALLAVVSHWLGGSWGWSAFILGVVYSFIGLLLAGSAVRSLKTGRVQFQRTRAEIEREKLWIKQKLAA